MSEVSVVTMTKKIKEAAGDTIAVLARLQLSYEGRIAQMERDMRKSKAGSKTRLDYLRALGREEREHTELLQSLGYFPKNLGLQTVQRYEFKAAVGLDVGLGTQRHPTLDAQFRDFPADRTLEE